MMLVMVVTIMMKTMVMLIIGDDDGVDVDDSGQVSGRVCPEQGATSSAPQGRNPHWILYNGRDPDIR